MSKPTLPTYKTTNWPSYNEAPKRRGSLTIWFDPAMNGAARFPDLVAEASQRARDHDGSRLVNRKAQFLIAVFLTLNYTKT